jgi:hypothetical protein
MNLGLTPNPYMHACTHGAYNDPAAPRALAWPTRCAPHTCSIIVASVQVAVQVSLSLIRLAERNAQIERTAHRNGQRNAHRGMHAEIEKLLAVQAFLNWQARAS